MRSTCCITIALVNNNNPQTWFALESNMPVIIKDLAIESRFSKS
jgi:hypothetical protein